MSDIGSMDIGTVVKYLNTHFPNLDVLPADISHPKGSRVRILYAELLMQILDLPERALTELPLDMIHPVYDPEVHGNTVVTFLLIFHLNNCLKDITSGQLETTPKDLFYPSADRTRAHLSVLVAFHQFRIAIGPHLKLITEHQKKQRVDYEKLKERVAQSEAVDLDTQFGAVREQLTAIQRLRETQEQEAKEAVHQVEVQEVDANNLKDRYTSIVARTEQLQATNDSIRIQLEMLKCDLVSSPDRKMALLNGLRRNSDEMASNAESHRILWSQTEDRLRSYTVAKERIESYDTRPMFGLAFERIKAREQQLNGLLWKTQAHTEVTRAHWDRFVSEKRAFFKKCLEALKAETIEHMETD